MRGGGGGVAHGEGTVYEHSLNKEAENPGEKGSDPVPRTVLLQIFWDKNETCLVGFVWFECLDSSSYLYSASAGWTSGKSSLRGRPRRQN